MILLDTSGLLSAIDERQRHHTACAAAVSRSRGPLLLSPFVLAELDYLLATRVSAQAQMALLDEVARGAYRLEPFSGADVAAARDVMTRHLELHLGLADASIVVLAARHGTRDVLTLDERHFRAVPAPDRRRFRLLPTDA
ncbi:MAG TPA: PIN domain-containing protein [Methylomirabilota bacterium]|nr:PIN domain-containing protein [Methylomirabilota bacterium]